MSGVLVLSCLWALAASATAMLPMRWQMAPGLALLMAAPVLIAALWIVHGPWAGVAGLAAFVSMFRRPLGALAGRLRGQR